MNTRYSAKLSTRLSVLLLLCSAWLNLHAQSLINIDFGVGTRSAKSGFAATGQSTNDFWNLFRFYDPKFTAGMPLVYSGETKDLKFADGSGSAVSIAVTNAPGVWGNASGDAMFDSYIFAQNGSNIVAKIFHLDAGRYNFFLYGHADPDASGEQNSIFRIYSAGTNYGPLTAITSTGWRATAPWQEGHQYVVFRDVEVKENVPVVIEVAPGANGIAVLNGLQISSKGTGAPRLIENAPPKGPGGATNLVIREIRYEGTLSDNEARFSAELEIESLSTNELSAPLFGGEVAVVPKSLPENVRIVRVGNQFRLLVAAPGNYKPALEVVAKITRAEPWNQISFTGPPAAIASIRAEAGGEGVELQLLSGTPSESEKSKSRVQGFLGADRTVALRWQSKAAEVSRKALITVETTALAQITPTVAKLSTTLRYEMLQAAVPRLTISIPAAQALTKLQGEQIRDWKIEPKGDAQILSVEFIKPVEKNYSLAIFTEASVDSSKANLQLSPPQPLQIERESGSFTISADDATVEIESFSGLRQINAPANALAAYRFYGRPIALVTRVKRIEPVVKVADRVTARLEESRLMVTHALALNVEKAGIYLVELTPQSGLTVSDVRGEGIEDWKMADGKLRVNFSSRVLGARNIEVQLETAHKTLPPQVVLTPLRVANASKETAQIGAAASAGLRVKTSEMIGLRGIPVTQLASHSDESLAFNSELPDWKLTLATERLPARIVADIFNLLTVGDGLVGGSATVRYELINQGAQQFRLKLPAHWKNVEFTGPNIRGKEQVDNVWTINLQEKAWEGYTLVVTYDYQFDAKHATLDASGLHALDAEHETGSVAITTAASLKLQPQKITEPLRAIDQSELAESDRALITRPVLLAYRYIGDTFQLQIDVTRHEEVNVLDAVADRTQLTSVITEAGQMLTQASFMVKNNDRQFQRFELPAGSEFWSCYVNGQPSKAERDGNWLLVSLPRGVNRDEAFAVDLVYAQKTDALQSSWIPKSLELQAPKTDVPNTYAEWQLFVPTTKKLSSFGGTMTVARGTTYGVRDAFKRFAQFYREMWVESNEAIMVFGGLIIIVSALLIGAARRGWNGIVGVAVLLVIVGIMGSMLLPSLSRAKQKSIRTSAANNLVQIGRAMRMFSSDNSERLPANLDEIKNLVGSEKALIDPESGEPFVYVGTGKAEGDANAVVAYSPVDNNGRNVLFGDGRVEHLTSERFEEAMNGSASSVAMSTYGANAVGYVNVTPPPVPSAAPAPESPVQNRPLAMGGLNATANGAVPPATHSDGHGSVRAGEFMMTNAVVASSPSAPKSVGIRSIRIDIPRSGQSFTFTKVLNLGGEPLAVKMATMSAASFAVIRSTVQLAAFAAGLFLLWREWHRRRSLGIAIGAGLVLGSVGALLISLRELHFALIALAPALLLILFILTVRKLWPRKAKPAPADIPPLPQPPHDGGEHGGIPPAIATILILAFLVQSASAQPVQSQNPAIGAPVEITNAVSILSANYSGAIRERVAQFDLSLRLSSASTNQSVTLFGDDVAVEQFATKSGEAKLLRENGKINLLLPQRGEESVELKFLVKLGGDVTKRHLSFAIPSALASHLSATIEEADADVDFPTAVSFKRTTSAQQTQIDAVVGPDDRVEMQWTPRVKRAAEIAATMFVDNNALVTFGNGVVDVRAWLNFQITQGELRQARVRLPAKQRLLRVEGDSIRTWELKPGTEAAAGSTTSPGEQILVVDLLKPVSPKYELTIETEAVLEKLPASINVQIPHALDVKRENGVAAIRGSEELSLSVESAQELQRVDAAELSGPQKAENVIAAYRFLKPGFQLAFRAEPVQPEIEAALRNRVRIGAEDILVTANITYTIKRAGVFALQLAYPGDYRVESVQGEGVVQWRERNVKEYNQLDVSLKDRTIGSFPLRVELKKNLSALPKTISVAGVIPLAVEKVTGFVSVSSEPGIALKATSFDGLTEVAAASIGENANANSGSAVLAYKFLDGKMTLTFPWHLEVATEVVESWVRAEIGNVVSVSENLISGRATVRYDIQNAPVKEFRLKIPAIYKNVDVTGANIRRRDQNGDEWRVELQNKVHGIFLLNVSWEQPIDLKTNALEVAGVQALGVERETGTVTIKAKSPLQVMEKSISGELMKIDTRELPDWVAVNCAPGEAAVLVYRYVRPGFRLALDAKRFEDAAVLQALVDSARLTTVVADDGEMMTELTLSVRNNGLQHLELELPGETKVWSAFVAGQPVRPAKRNGKLLLPLEEFSSGDDAAVTVELTYVGAEKFPKTKGAVNLVSPKLDVPLKNARWELFLPPDYDYKDFTGSMTHQNEAAPVARSYSLAEYRVQEVQKKASRKLEAQTVLSNAKSKWAKGDYKGFNGAVNNLRLGDFADDESGRREAADLTKNYYRMQSGNLLKQAPQTGYSMKSAREGVPQQKALISEYDAEVAAKQVEKLQQAQELTVAKVQPLRVNLPTRGLHHSFSQVLQTEVARAMTIQFVAVNEQRANWIGQSFGVVAAFALLWLAIGYLVKEVRRTRVA